MFHAPLIAFEGLDGAGKSSLCRRIHEHLSETNNKLSNLLYTPELISFPRRHTPTGEILHKYLTKELELDQLVAHHLFSANRWEIKEHVEYLLQSHHPVILDRYVTSGIAYTVAKGNFSIDFCKQFNVGLPRPDLTIYLKKESETSHLQTRPSRERYETQPFQEKVKNVIDELEEDEDTWFTIYVRDRSSKSNAAVQIAAIKAVDRVISKFQQAPIPISYYQ